jgi:subtilisin-like proprotein convertase family protein
MTRPSTRAARRRTLARAATLLALVTSAALVAGATADVSAAKAGHRARGHHVVTAKALPSKVFSFVGANTGAIPDATGTPGTCNQTAGTRDVTFAVSGLTAPITNVSVSMALTHTFGSDLSATLIAPDGVTQSPIFIKPTTVNTSCGSAFDFTGLAYTFNDQASGSFWAALTSGNPPAGAYRATGANSSTALGLSAAFASVTSPNGTWTLRVTDTGTGDTGSIGSAGLALTASDGAACAAATAKLTAAQAALADAANKAAAAAKALQKAKAKLKAAKRSGDPAKIKKAKKRVKKAKAAKKAADAAVATAQAAVAAAQAEKAGVC